jgi:hypothetical protein
MKKFALLPVALVSAAASVPAFAQSTGGPDFSALTGAIDTTSTIAAILAVGALVIGVSLSVMGVRKVIAMVRGA